VATDTRQTFIVTLSGARPVQEVVNDLKAGGLEVDQVMDAIGTVTGSAKSQTLERLRQVNGVTDISPDHPVDIGPPGAPVS
jgi:hypothetical protein